MQSAIGIEDYSTFDHETFFVNIELGKYALDSNLTKGTKTGGRLFFLGLFDAVAHGFY
jgi:hypothetical protein